MRWVTAVIAVVAAALFVVTTTPTDAFIITPLPTITVITNGVIERKPRFIPECQFGDQDVATTFLAGSSDSITYKCPKVIQPYVVKLVGYTPDDAQILSFTTAVTSNLAGLSLINTTIPDAPYLPPELQPRGRQLLSLLPPRLLRYGHRVLLELQVTAPNGQWGQFPDQDYVQAVCTSALAQGEDISQYSVCADGPTTADYNNIKIDRQAALANFQAFIGSVTHQQQVQTDFLSDLGKTEVGFLNYTEAMKPIVNNIAREINITKDKEDAIYTSLTKDIRAQDAPITQTKGDIGAAAFDLEVIANVTKNNMQKIVLADFRLAEQVMDSLARLSNYAKMTKRQMLQLFDAIENDQVTLYTSLKRWYTQDDVRIAANKQLWLALKQFQGIPNARGRILYPFTEDIGRPPAEDLGNLGPLYNHMTIMDGVIREHVLDVDTNTVYGYMTRIKPDCGSVTMLRKSVVGPKWRAMLGWFGPDNCDASWDLPNNVQDPGFCKCVATVVDRRCVLQNTLGVPTDSALDAFKRDVLEVDTTTGCVATGVPGDLDGYAIRSYDDWTYVFSTIGKRVAYNNNPAPYRFSCRTNGAASDVLYDPRMVNASNFMDLATDSSVDPNANLVAAYLRMMASAYPLAYDHLDSYSAAIDGVLADGMQQIPLFYRKYAQGKLGRGWKLYLALFSSQYLLVSRLNMGRRMATAQVTINGVSTSVEAPTIRNPYRSLLPTNDVIIWDPARSNQKWWDLDDVDISPEAGLRFGMPSLVICPSPETCTRDVWQQQNGEPFPHKEVDTAANYEVDLDSDSGSPTFGQCLAPSVSGSGGVCTMLSHTKWTFIGTFTQYGVDGNAIAQEVDAETIGEPIEYFGGPIKEMSQSACPTLERIGNSGVEIVLLLRNTLPDTNKIIVSQYGPCSTIPGPKPVTIGGGAVAAVPVFPCLVGDGTQNFVKFTTVNANGVYTDCVGLVNLTLPTGSGIDPSIAASFQNTIRINSVHTSVVSSLVHDAINELHNLTYTYNDLARQEMTSYGFQVPDDTLDGYGDVQDSLDQIVANATQRAYAVSTTVTNFTSITYPFDEELREIAQDQETHFQQITDIQNAIDADNGASTLKLAEYQKVVPYILQTEKRFVVFWTLWGTAVYDALREATSIITVDFIEKNWDRPVPGEPSPENGWDYFGDQIVALANLGDDEVDELANHLVDIYDGASSFLVDGFEHVILPILIMGAIVIGGGVALYFGIRFFYTVGQTANKKVDASKLDPSLVTMYERAKELSGGLADLATLLAP